MGQDPSVHAIPASQRELCSHIGECAFHFFFFISCEQNLFLRASRRMGQPKKNLSMCVRECACACVCANPCQAKVKEFIIETQSLSTREYPKSLGQRLKLRWRNQIVSLFYPAFFLPECSENVHIAPRGQTSVEESPEWTEHRPTSCYHTAGWCSGASLLFGVNK